MMLSHSVGGFWKLTAVSNLGKSRPAVYSRFQVALKVSLELLPVRFKVGIR